MAIVDRHGHAEAGTQGQGDVTNASFEPPMKALLPNGPAWPRDDATLRTLVKAICTELSRLRLRQRKLDRETNPATTTECVADWEASYGLPDCAQPETLEARRAAIAAKLLAQTGHSQGLPWWLDVLEKLGYPPHFVLQGVDVFDCEDDCDDELTDEEWMFVWQIFVDHGLDDALLQCFVAHNAQIATLPIVHFMWEKVIVPEPATLLGVAATSDGYLVAVGAGAKILRAGANYWLGTNWDLGTPDPDDQEDLYAVANVGTVLVACGVNPVNFYRSTDHGATWTSTGTASAEMYAITAGIGDGVAIAAGEDGTCWRSFDYGASWAAGTTITGTPVIQGLTRCGNGVDIAAVVACGQNGRIYRTPNSGTLWTTPYIDTAPLNGIAAWQLVVIAVGDNGTIVRSVDGAQSFIKANSPTNANLRAVVGSPTGRWTAVGVGGVIIQSLDDGVTWDLQASPTTETLYAVTRHVPSNRAVIVGANTTIILE